MEFDWDPEHLSDEPPLEGLPTPITIDMVKKAISKMKSGKAAGPSDWDPEHLSDEPPLKGPPAQSPR